MKIRTDFVTNSSSSSFATVRVDDIELTKSLGYSNRAEMNEALEETVRSWYDIFEYQPPFAALTDLTGLFILLAINDPDIKADLVTCSEKALEEHDDEKWRDWWNNVFSHTLGDDIKDKIIKRYIENHTLFFDKFTRAEGDINGLSFDIGYHNDGGYGPFLHVRISNGKRLTIVTEERYDKDAYRGENIEGFEFFMLGKPEDYSSYDSIVAYIQKNGGSITTELTNTTRYAVFPLKPGEKYWPKPAVEARVMENVYSECVPLVSERAFAYRWLNADIDIDFDEFVFMPRFGEYLEWFEIWGYGRVTVERWINGNWQNIARERCRGKSFAITGKLISFADKDQFAEYVRSQGGSIYNRLSAKVMYYVNNDHQNSQKNIKANELGVTVITEARFIDMFGQPE